MIEKSALRLIKMQYSNDVHYFHFFILCDIQAVITALKTYSQFYNAFQTDLPINKTIPQIYKVKNQMTIIFIFTTIVTFSFIIQTNML